jgi:two-component system, OmpR family, phosphate regulon sensor histidine kinase PhoR
MLVFWRREIIKSFIVGFVAAIVWAVEGHLAALAFLCLALAVAHLLNLRSMAALTRWLTRGDASVLPPGSGSWEELAATLYRTLRGTKQSQDQLHRAVARFREAAAAMPDGVIILDEQDRIDWCNPSAQQHFGLDLDKDRLSHVSYLIRQPEFGAYLGAQNYGEPIVLRSVRNTELVLAVQLIPYGDRQKLLLSHDITQWEKAETARRDFVANVSHELRTPLTVVGGFLETLAGAQPPDAKLMGRSVELMTEQTERMKRLVEDLLTLSQLESAPAAAIQEHVDVAAMVAILEREGEQLSQGRHRFSTEVLSAQQLFGNAQELHSAFGNLVSNAVRYTPAGGEIRIGWSVDGASGVFAVEDTGVGIEAEHIPRLTERFYRVERSRSRESGGTGLGLAIVKHALARHQAKLVIASQLGKGSRFAAVFPAARVTAPQKARAVALE